MAIALHGRRVIKTDETEVAVENVVSILRKALPYHWKNRSEINYLWHYYKGRQPILNRVKLVRPEIANMFGNLESYDKVLITDDMSCPIDENTVLFIDKEPEVDSRGRPVLGTLLTWWTGLPCLTLPICISVTTGRLVM